MQLSASPVYYYILEYFNIICTNYLVTEKISTQPQNIITWISSFEILDKPPCCVRQCGTSFPFYILGVPALSFYSTSSLHNTCSSSGLLFFAHLGGIIFIAHYIYYIHDRPNNLCIYFLFTTQLHNNLEIQVSTYGCLV